MKNTKHRILQEKLEKRAFEKPGYRSEVNIKTYIKEWDLSRWAGFMCLRIATNNEFLQTSDPKTRGAVSLSESDYDVLRQTLFSS